MAADDAIGLPEAMEGVFSKSGRGWAAFAEYAQTRGLGAALDKAMGWTSAAGPLEGRTEVGVKRADNGTITDIDRIQDGVLWEEKEASFPPNEEDWIIDKVVKKFDRYVEAREQLPGYEEAPI